MFGLKIFVRVQTFRRGPPAQLLPPCHDPLPGYGFWSQAENLSSHRDEYHIYHCSLYWISLTCFANKYLKASSAESACWGCCWKLYTLTMLSGVFSFCLMSSLFLWGYSLSWGETCTQCCCPAYFLSRVQAPRGYRKLSEYVMWWFIIFTICTEFPSLVSRTNIFFFIFIHSLVSFWRVHKGLRHMLW